MKILALFIAFAFFQPFFTTAQIEIIAGPYIQNLRDDSITIM